MRSAYDLWGAPVSETTPSDTTPSAGTSAPSAKDQPKTATLAGIIVLLIGAIITGAVSYIFGVLNDDRKSELAFVNAQIETLYGPLYALTQANDETWTQFKSRYWRVGSKCGSFFSDSNPPTVEETKRWRHWVP
jgi:uncharacterized protein HemX